MVALIGVGLRFEAWVIDNKAVTAFRVHMEDAVVQSLVSDTNEDTRSCQRLRRAKDAREFVLNIFV